MALVIPRFNSGSSIKCVMHVPRESRWNSLNRGKQKRSIGCTSSSIDSASSQLPSRKSARIVNVCRVAALFEITGMIVFAQVSAGHKLESGREPRLK